MNLDYYRLRINGAGNKNLPHPLFRVPYDIYQWYSECVYNTTTEELLELLDDFEKIRKDLESVFSENTDIFNEYKLVAHIIWRTYHKLQAKPLLEAIINYDNTQSETHFYLGQIYQDIKDFQKAITHYNKFVELEPNLIPENNYFIDGWFLYTHAYAPSTTEALTNLGDLFLNYNQDYQKAKEYYIKAIILSPNYHLAPYTHLAKLLKGEQNFSGALKAYKKAIKNYFQTKWKGYPEIEPCYYYPELESWAKEKYPFTYRGHNSKETGIFLFAKELESLSDLFCTQAQDLDRALECIGVAHRAMKKAKFTSSIDLYLKQIEIVLKHYKDYWQAEVLCNKVLALDNSNKKAKEYLNLIKIKI